ncbi:hypothetical protein PV10_08683 [Exophiala mesophila]|uniref:Uncharacterized protein n=1 Tax=Exophiala mesophila TaxID=212818 RepID=A0A0D1ZQN9_EXOME|nr:uncharacterized protein PV10_08683 [Exophiala mesophila]KIV89073.1 hypothetical protein PV10_08683 [Exophiala mesophila]
MPKPTAPERRYLLTLVPMYAYNAWFQQLDIMPSRRPPCHHNTYVTRFLQYQFSSDRSSTKFLRREPEVLDVWNTMIVAESCGVGSAPRRPPLWTRHPTPDIGAAQQAANNISK